MKSRQLANILIKIVGLYICLCGIPSLVSMLAGTLLWAMRAPHWEDSMVYEVPNGIAAAVQFVVGLFLIIKSRSLAEFWFKEADE
jgi:hypothetical protein